jgi:hypothetical protein
MCGRGIRLRGRIEGLATQSLTPAAKAVLVKVAFMARLNQPCP